ncbi:hypothetical protein [Thiomicrorhabdus sp.]|uniref:hypothetical protein n=1 Tax=Thiomicrorhabdus sp. TaxID=2039724 RepID=UPI0029C965D8|nr:hypothetical protein [Thiomicrorhabdus sp.]
MKVKLVFTAVILSMGITGCVNVKTNIPSTKSNSLGGASSVTPVSAEYPCGKPKNKYDDVYHQKDKRWCSNQTMPGASWSPVIKHSEIIHGVGVDLAYHNAKNLLKFYEPNQNKPWYMPAAEDFDKTPGVYYKWTSTYGGPGMQLTWLVRYTMEIKPVTEKSSRVTITYKTYSKGVDPQEFQRGVMAKVKEK